MLKIENLHVKIQDFELKNISFSLKKGEYHLLLGPSGSGKTMLLNTIAGFTKVLKGNISFNTVDITTLPPNKREISYLFQELALFPHKTVFENIAYPLKIRNQSSSQIKLAVNSWMSYTEISHLAKRYPNSLSGGEKQRVALARCLVMDTNLLLLDEPFSAIDAQLKESFITLLKKISNSGISVIHVTHNYEEAIELAHTVSLIENGCMVKTGNFLELIQKPESGFQIFFSKKKNFFENPAIVLTDSTITFECGNQFNLTAQHAWNNLSIKGIYILPEKVHISEQPFLDENKNTFEGKIVQLFQTKNEYSCIVNYESDIEIEILLNDRLSFVPEINKTVYFLIEEEAIRPIFV